MNYDDILNNPTYEHSFTHLHMLIRDAAAGSKRAMTDIF